jgi:membrane protease subunit HflK
VDAILVSEVAAFKDAVRRRVAELLARRGVGVTVEQVELDSRPPLSLKADFARVTDAVQQRDKLINEARNYENQTLSRAEADAASAVNRAESERQRLVESIRAEADRFEELLPRYRSNPDLFVQLQLAEALSRSMSRVQDTIYLQDRLDGQSREMRLLLNRLPARPKPQAPATP